MLKSMDMTCHTQTLNVTSYRALNVIPLEETKMKTEQEIKLVVNALVAIGDRTTPSMEYWLEALKWVLKDEGKN